MITPEEFQRLIPLACRWAESQERLIVENGRPLTSIELDLARSMDIRRAERIRVLVVDQVPSPELLQIRLAAQHVGLFGS
ncbi:MAG: hypothetical protein JWO95_2885, partial [Verrucomicrobiales bacterium]|nr:hypothetical protein [Verrucomicrobiales bacterium]